MFSNCVSVYLYMENLNQNPISWVKQKEKEYMKDLEQTLSGVTNYSSYGEAAGIASVGSSLSFKMPSSTGSASMSATSYISEYDVLKDDIKNLKKVNQSLLALLENIVGDRQKELDDIRKMINE